MVIGEVFRRLFAKIVLRARGAQAKEACRNVNLCSGVKAGIEGGIHTVRELEEIGRGGTGK